MVNIVNYVYLISKKGIKLAWIKLIAKVFYYLVANLKTISYNKYKNCINMKCFQLKIPPLISFN